MKKQSHVHIMALMLFVGSLGFSQAQTLTSGSIKGLKLQKVLSTPGGNVDWCYSRNLVAFDKMRDDDYYDIFVMRPDGSNMRCLSCGQKDMPQRNIGQPLWSPDGKYIVCQVEKAKHPRTFFSFVAHPTAGVFSDLWIIEYATEKARPLYEVSTGKDFGTLRPHFSPDGKILVWAEMYDQPSLTTDGKEVGHWRLMAADFVDEKSGPKLRNIRRLPWAGKGFYQIHSFMPDGSNLLVCSNDARPNTSIFSSNDISLLDLKSGRYRRLTFKGYNEHAFPTPDGKQIIWAHAPEEVAKGTDYWIMNIDGSEKRQLTFFNKPGHPQYNGKPFVACDFTWSKDGNTIIAYAHDGWEYLKKVGERVVKLEVVRSP